MLLTKEPIKAGSTVTAQCGAIVQNANFMPLANPPSNSVIFCRKCFGPLHSFSGEFYVCAVTEGQTAIDLEAGVNE